MVGAHVQCLFSDAAHLKDCANFPGAPKDNRPCDCKWWDATIIQYQKNHGFSVNHTMKDINQGWEEHGVDISRLRPREVGPEAANDGAVERDLTNVLQLAATSKKWQKYWSCDWLDTHATGAQWPTGMRQGQWGEPTVCPQWQRFLHAPVDEVLTMLQLRPECIASSVQLVPQSFVKTAWKQQLRLEGIW